MNKIKIITDGCSDMKKEWREKYDIDYVPLTLIWDGKERVASADWDDFGVKELYDAIRAGVSVKSNQVSVKAFEEIFNKYLDEGYDIVYVGCTSALSGTVTTGMSVAKSIMEKREGAKIIVIDPPISCGGEALLAIEASKLAAQGLTAEEVAEKVTELGKRAYQVGTVDTLTYLKRSGRVKATAAFFGNLFGIKPILINGANGANVAVKKVKGRKNALDLCVKMLYDSMNCADQTYPASEQTVYVGHADCPETAEYLKAEIEKTIKPKEILVNDISAVIGASVGPTMIGLYAFGEPAGTGASEK